jgi:hypothetical protein
MRLWVVLSIAAFAAHAETPNALKVWFSDGSGVELRTQAWGANAPVSTSGEQSVPEGSDFHRVVFGKDGKLLFGYDVEARAEDGGTTLVLLKPVDTNRFAIGGNAKWLDIPTLKKTRTVQAMRVGDKTTLDILQNPSTGELIYDVLTVLQRRAPANGSEHQGRPRFSLRDVKVVVAGKTLLEQHGTWMVSAGIMVHVPEHGDYYLTFAPAPVSPKFEAAGWVDHTVLRFQVLSDLVEITSKTPVLQGGEYGTVWVHREPGDEGLRELRKKFSARHPDVLALEAQMASVWFRCGNDVESLLRGQ